MRTYLTRDLLVPALLVATGVLVLVSLPAPAEAAIRVDGGWSPWSSVRGFCVRPDNNQALVDCGGGVMKKYRSCTNPSPQGSGSPCAGVSEEHFPCNTNPCALPTEFMWSEWSECTAR